MFLVCGEALYDFFAQSEGAQGAIQFDARPGGSPFNVALGLARLGRPVGLLTGLSGDLLGARLRAMLAAEGVSQDYLIHKTALTTVSIVGSTPQGTPAYAFYGDGAADRIVTPDELPAALPGVEGLHFGSYSIVAEPTASAFAALAEREKGARLISLDPNIRPTVEPDLDIWRARVAQLGACADVIKISDEDFALLYGDTPHENWVADRLSAGVRVVCLTRGGEGALGWTAAGRVEARAPKITVADTVGAGDTFQAGLIDGLCAAGFAQTTPDLSQLEAIMRFAARAAAITCSRRGADLPTRAEVEAFAG